MTFHRKGNFYLTFSQERVYLIASTFDASLKHDSDVIDALKRQNYMGDVTVDMLLKNGNISTRFLSIFFDGKRFKTRDAKVVKDKENVLLIEKDFYKKHVNLVKNSILTMSEKVALLSGNGLTR